MHSRMHINIYLETFRHLYTYMAHLQQKLRISPLSVLFSRWQPPEKWIHGAAKAAVPSGTAKEVILENPLDVLWRLVRRAGKRHRNESRWRRATPKRWRIVFGAMIIQYMGVAPSTFQVI